MISEEKNINEGTDQVQQSENVLLGQPEGKRFKLLVGDKRIWIIVMALMIISLLEVFSASSRCSFDNTNYLSPVLPHLVFMVLGFAAMVIVPHIPCRYYKTFTYPLLILSAVLLLILFVKGFGNSNAQRWLNIFGIQFQPSELAKMAVLLYTASIASQTNKNDENNRKESFWKILICLVIFSVLIIGENLSTTVLLCAAVVLTMFISGVSYIRTFKLICVGLLSVAIFFAFFLLVPKGTMNKMADMNLIPERALTWQARMLDFVDEKQTAKEYAEETAKDKPQETHAKIAIATSDFLWGKGIGNSEERDFIQEATCDFIYAIIIEECGMVIAIIVLGLYVWLMYICGTLVSKNITPFARYLVVGISLLIGMQAMMNMMVAVGAMPVTGQPLPLISKGGTSMLFSSIYFGFLLGISYDVEQREKKQKQESGTVQDIKEYE